MTPTTKIFGTNGFAAPQSLGKPAAVFPGAVVTDSDMMIAVDRQQTRLALPMSTGDTSMTVVDPSAIVPYCLLTIDTETVKVTGPAVGNVIPIARGFDGSTPAVHLASAVVSGFVDAYHHNRVVAEIEAIQQTLGANLSRIPTSSQIISKAFDFPCQSPGGSLIVGNNSIILTPVPLGVNGSDTGHYLYISGGTGAAEAVLITGGSAVAGAASGTVIVQCANTHSGAWMICSATAGIQEAIGGGTCDVYVPVGAHQIYGPVSLKYGTYLHGGGTLATTLLAAGSASMIVLSLNTIPGYANVTIENMQIDASTHFPTVNTVTAVSVVVCYNVRIAELLINNCSKGIVLDRVHSVMVDSINTLGNVTLFVGATTNSGAAAVYPWPSAVYSNGVMISNWNAVVHISGNANVPVMTFQFVATCYVSKVQMTTDDPSRVGISVANHCEDVIFSELGILAFNPLVSIVDSGWTRIQHSSFAVATNGVGLFLRSGYCTMIQNSHLNGPATQFIDIGASASGYPPDYVMVSGNQIAGVQTGAAVTVEPNVKNFMIVGNLFLNASNPGPTNDIYIASGTSDYFVIIANTFALGTPPSNALSDNSTGNHKYIQANAGLGPYAQFGTTLASASGLNITNAIHKVSGTAAIDNINYFGNTILPGQLLYLIPTGAFTTTTAGNISAASTAIVGKVMMFMFDGAKWNPSY